MGKLALGQSYVLTARVKATGNNGCVLGFAAVNTKEQGARLEQRLIFRGDWNTRSSIFTLPANSDWAAVFLAGTGDECWFDDIRLHPANALQPGPLRPIVVNGGFEKGFFGWEVQGGELLRGVGLEGKQSLVARGNARLEQIVPAQVFQVGPMYELQASVSKNSGQGRCAVNLSGVSPSGLSLSQQLIFEEATQAHSWLQKSVLFSIPEDTAWITLQVETKNASCSFDGIRIVQQVASK